MKLTLSLLLFLSISVSSMIHSDTAFSIVIVRENQLGRYDTTYKCINTIFEFQQYYLIDGKYYTKPTYFIDIKEKLK